jgi:hypothetical protein
MDGAETAVGLWQLLASASSCHAARDFKSAGAHQYSIIRFQSLLTIQVIICLNPLCAGTIIAAHRLVVSGAGQANADREAPL